MSAGVRGPGTFFFFDYINVRTAVTATMTTTTRDGETLLRFEALVYFSCILQIIKYGHP